MRLIALLCLLIVAGTASAAHADATPSPAPQTPVAIATDRLDTMLRTGHADASWFSDSFLAQIPVSKLDEIVASLTTSLGAYQRIEFTPSNFVAHFAKGTDDILIHLDDNNKIDRLWFKPPVVSTASLDDALGSLRSMQGTVSYVITEEGRPERAAFNADAPLAVGSAFKLAVLSALQDEIREGKRRWTDVVLLSAQWKSLPTGVLQRWPDQTPMTIASYASEMISISDNTAADTLIHLVRGADLAKYQETNVPFLTTREMFILKSTGARALRSAYSAATTARARSTVLARVDAEPLPAANELLATPDLAIEWHYSARDLCGFMSRVAGLPLMSINPGVADAGDFRRVAFKGGSDTGAINLTTMLVTKHGSRFCFSATLNDPSKPLDDTAFETAYAAAVRQLATL